MKIFLSHNMHGLTDEEVYKLRDSAIVNLHMNRHKYMIPDSGDIEIINNYVHENAPENAGRVWYLGASIQKMSEADLVVFIPQINIDIPEDKTHLIDEYSGIVINLSSSVFTRALNSGVNVEVVITSLYHIPSIWMGFSKDLKYVVDIDGGLYLNDFTQLISRTVPITIRKNKFFSE